MMKDSLRSIVLYSAVWLLLITASSARAQNAPGVTDKAILMARALLSKDHRIRWE